MRGVVSEVFTRTAMGRNYCLPGLLSVGEESEGQVGRVQLGTDFWNVAHIKYLIISHPKNNQARLCFASKI